MTNSLCCTGREPLLRPLSQVSNYWAPHILLISLTWFNHQSRQLFTHNLFLFFSLFLVVGLLFIVIRAHHLACSEEAGKVVLAVRVPQSQHLADRPLIVFVEALVVPRGILKGCQKQRVIWDVFLWRATQQQRAPPARQRKRKGPRVICWGLCNRCRPESYCPSVTFIILLLPVSTAHSNPRQFATACTCVSVD